MPQRLSDVPLSELVPETKAWNGGNGIDLLAWLGCTGSIEQAIACGELFWPDFVEFDGCVLFAGFNAESYNGFLAQTGGDRQSVESVMNHRHIGDIFPGKEPTREQVVYLGRLLGEIWLTKLKRDFPGKSFTINLPQVNDDGCVDDDVITFTQMA